MTTVPPTTTTTDPPGFAARGTGDDPGWLLDGLDGRRPPRGGRHHARHSRRRARTIDTAVLIAAVLIGGGFVQLLVQLAQLAGSTR